MQELMLASAANGLDQLDVRGPLERDRIPFVRIEVDFQLDVFSRTNGEIFQYRCAAGGFDAKVQPIAIFAAIVFEVSGAHVHVAHGANDARCQFYNALGTDEHTAGCIAMVGRDSHRKVNTERNAVGEGEFDLAGTATGAENANFGQHAATGANHRHGLPGGEVAILIQILLNFELGTGAKQNGEMFFRKMNVSRGNIHHQRVPRDSRRCWRAGRSRRRKLSAQYITNDPLDILAVGGSKS